jgi:myo-inositol-1(or 4)-monophosphatase
VDDERAQLVVELYDLAVAAAQRAGRFLVEERPADLGVAATKSSPTDIVTAMDTAAERMIAGFLRERRPHDAFLGEEGTSAPATGGPARVRWVVDPIDGTVNYLHAIPAWAVSVAAELDGVVVAGVVVNPVLGETFAARLGDGATRNGAPISVAPAPELAHAVIATGFGYDRDRRDRQAATVRQVLPQVADIRRMGAASLDLCALACGRVDGYYERGLKPWDHAAGGLIAREAGARVEGLAGAVAGERLVVGSSPGLFDPLHAILVLAEA